MNKCFTLDEVIRKLMEMDKDDEVSEVVLQFGFTLQHYHRRFVTLIARRCKVKFFRNRFVYIFVNIFNNLYGIGGRCFSNWG